MTALVLNDGPTSVLSGSVGNAVGDAAKWLESSFFRPAFLRLREADTWNRIAPCVEALQEIYAESSSSNWDGYGAEAVTAGAVDEVFALLNSLPRSLPRPELTPEPDGSMALEWENGPNRLISLSVNGKGVIVYAGLIGKGSKAHGMEVFNDSLPENLVAYINRIFR